MNNRHSNLHTIINRVQETFLTISVKLTERSNSVQITARKPFLLHVKKKKKSYLLLSHNKISPNDVRGVTDVHDNYAQIICRVISPKRKPIYGEQYCRRRGKSRLNEHSPKYIHHVTQRLGSSCLLAYTHAFQRYRHCIHYFIAVVYTVCGTVVVVQCWTTYT